MSKHTPGPHNANQKYVIVRGGERYFPIHAKKRGMIALAKRESDAYLYAAAPELLSLLKEISENSTAFNIAIEMDFEKDGESWMWRVKTAITKATGETKCSE